MNLIELTNIKLTQEEFDFVKSKLDNCKCILINEHRKICNMCNDWRQRHGIDPYISAKAWMNYNDRERCIL